MLLSVGVCKCCTMICNIVHIVYTKLYHEIIIHAEKLKDIV